MNSGPEVRLLNRGAGGRQSCMDTGTLPIVRPGFLKKWTFYSSSHPPAGGRGGQTWPKHPTLLPQQQGLVEGSPERDLRVPIHGGIGGHWGVLWALSSTHGLWIPCSGCQLKHLGKKKKQNQNQSLMSLFGCLSGSRSEGTEVPARTRHRVPLPDYRNSGYCGHFCVPSTCPVAEVAFVGHPSCVWAEQGEVGA